MCTSLFTFDKGLYQLNLVYKEIRRYLPSFLTLFKLNGPFYPSNNDADAILSYTTKMMSSANPENYLQFNQRKFLEIVEQFYDRMLKVVVNNTIHTLSQPRLMSLNQPV